MAQLERKPDPVKPGQWQLSATDLNRAREIILRQIRGGGDSRVSYFGDRAVVSSSFSQDRAGPIDHLVQMVVLEEFDDYLLCTPFLPPVKTGTAALLPQTYDLYLGLGSIVYAYVAKPYFLQKTPWDGQIVALDGLDCLLTYTGLGRRTATSTDDSQPPLAQTLSPGYVSGDIVMATHAQTGHTGPDDIPVVWMDLNTAARRWDSSPTSGEPTSGEAAIAVVVQEITARDGDLLGCGYVQYHRHVNAGSGDAPGGQACGLMEPVGDPVLVLSFYTWRWPVGHPVGVFTNFKDGKLWVMAGQIPFPIVTEICCGVPSGSPSGLPNGSGTDCAGYKAPANDPCCPDHCWDNPLHLTVTGCTELDADALVLTTVGTNSYFSTAFEYNGQSLHWEYTPNGYVSTFGLLTCFGPVLQLVTVDGTVVATSDGPLTPCQDTPSGTIVIPGGEGGVGGSCGSLTLDWSVA